MISFEDLLSKLAHPAQRALVNAGISSLEDLTRYSEREIAQLHGIGRNALEKIRVILLESNFHFRED